jgi:NADH:quinone reductase (non-electrogenic)
MRILILGGGFAGLHAAIHLDGTLARDPDVEITLINRENFFLFTPMLHEVAASDLDLTKSSIRCAKFSNESIFSPEKSSQLTSNPRLWRYLMVSTIIITISNTIIWYSAWVRSPISIICQGSRNALTMKSLGDAIHLRNRLIALLEEADTECCANVRGPLLTLVGCRWRLRRCGNHCWHQ